MYVTLIVDLFDKRMSIDLGCMKFREPSNQDSASAFEDEVSFLGEGVSMEKLLLRRKEADLQEREASIKAAEQTFGGKREEIVLLRMEAENLEEITVDCERGARS